MTRNPNSFGLWHREQIWAATGFEHRLTQLLEPATKRLVEGQTCVIRVATHEQLYS